MKKLKRSIDFLYLPLFSTVKHSISKEKVFIFRLLLNLNRSFLSQVFVYFRSSLPRSRALHSEARFFFILIRSTIQISLPLVSIQSNYIFTTLRISQLFYPCSTKNCQQRNVTYWVKHFLKLLAPHPFHPESRRFLSCHYDVWHVQTTATERFNLN